MPLYDYKCPECGDVHEARFAIDQRDRDDVVCPACGSAGCRREVSAASVTGISAGSDPALPPCATPT